MTSEATLQVRRESKRRLDEWGEQAVLAGICLSALAGFTALASAIVRDRNGPFDRSIVDLVGRSRRPFGNAVARALTFFGGPIGGPAMVLGALGLVRRNRPLAAQVSIGSVGGILAELVVKRFFLRKRPTLLEHLERVQSSSFPSGHSMAAASIYLTLAFVAARSKRLHAHRAALLGGAGVFASLVGGTRVYLGVHWPTDVLGGLSLGTAWACATEAAFDLGATEEEAPQLANA